MDILSMRLVFTHFRLSGRSSYSSPTRLRLRFMFIYSPSLARHVELALALFLTRHLILCRFRHQTISPFPFTLRTRSFNCIHFLIAMFLLNGFIICLTAALRLFGATYLFFRTLCFRSSCCPIQISQYFIYVIASIIKLNGSLKKILFSNLILKI